MTSEESRQIDELILRKNVSIARMGLHILVGFELLSFVIDRFVITHQEKLDIMTYSHVFMIVFCVISLTLGRRNPVWMVRLHLPCVLPVFLRYAFLLYGDLAFLNRELAMLKSTLATSLVGVFIIVLTPQSKILIPALLTALFSVCLATMLASIPSGNAVAIIGVVGYLAALAWKYYQIAGRRQAAALEIKHRALVVQAERSRLQIEMDLASAIQDSLRPATTLTSGRLKADFYMLKHGSVGGDWFAAQVRPGGGMLVLIVDATGKGLQAALVVHAVQSLWTAAMADDSFNPKAWILQVNDVLTSMGQGTAHTVTLALADIRPNQMIYWSAGHGPAYLRSVKDGASRLTANFALGNILGVGPSKGLTLKPTIVPLDQERSETIYLGTDGVLVGSARKDIRTIEALELTLPSQGAQALAATAIEDDKAYVRIELKPEAAAKAS